MKLGKLLSRKFMPVVIYEFYSVVLCTRGMLCQIAGVMVQGPFPSESVGG